MKIKLASLIALLLCYSSLFCQTTDFNFGFEQNRNEEDLPDGWFQWGTYQLQKDTNTTRTGNNSGLVLGNESGDSFGCITYKIPAMYAGKKITLEAYMKIEDVSDGFSGLLMRLDGESGFLGFDNMQSRKITGT